MLSNIVGVQKVLGSRLGAQMVLGSRLGVQKAGTAYTEARRGYSPITNLLRYFLF